MTVTESWLRVLVGNLRAGVLLEDQQRRILLANQAFCDLFGVGAPPESLVGGDCAGLAAAPLFADPDAFLTRVDEILTRGQPVLGEVLAMADGRRVERNYQPVEVDGVVVGRLWQYRDVTKQHRAAEALRDFLAHVSHEIRTPLNAILGLTEVVLGGELEGGVRAHLDRVHSNAEALHGLISDILDLSKVEAGQMDLEAVEP